MKMKAKFDKTALVGFFANNGEKIVFGIVVLLFFMFVYNAVKCERYEKLPEELDRAAAQARQHIQDSDPPVDREIIDYRTKIEEISDPIAATPYKLPTIWEPPIFPPLRKRGEPVLFPAEHLVGTPGHGQIADASRAVGNNPGMMGQNDPAGKRWIVVTGLVNMEKYIKSYEECFEDVAYKQQTDYPNFITYRVERAEVTDENQDPSTLNWEKPYRGNMRIYQSKYVTNSRQPDQTDPNLINSALAFPLPSRLDRDWGEEVLHAPEIPMIDPRTLTQRGNRVVNPVETPEETPEGEDDDVDDVPDVPTNLGRRGGMGMPGMGMEMGMGMPGMAGRGMGRNGMNAQEEEEVSPYVLFRFFDFNVEPGKQYRYRVRLFLTNPNFEVPEQYLDPEIARITNTDKWKPYIETAWSDPSEVVNMPLDDSLLINQVAQSTRTDSEPTGTVTAIHWDLQKGTEVFDEFEVDRGMVVNLYDQEVPAMAPAAAPGLGGPQPGAQPPRRGARGPQREKVDYVTEMLVLDLDGGDRLPGRNRDLNEPSSMLLFSPTGTMMVRTSKKDAKELEALKNPKAGRMRRGGGMMPGEMMMMPGEMGMPGEMMMGP